MTSVDPLGRPEADTERIRLEGHASGSGRVYQSGRDQYVAEGDQFIAQRDQHLHYHDGVRETRRVGSATVIDECPYPGLAAFGADQAPWFFGRDRLIAEVTARLADCLRDGGLLAVVAPSGAGKSSLLRAGLLPALDRGALPVTQSRYWPRLLLTPTAYPIRTLAAHVAALTGDDPAALARALASDPGQLRLALGRALYGRLGPDRDAGARVVLVVDQFEELFTLCGDERERQAFIAMLASAAGVGLVVIGLRADFYAPCTNYPALRAALQSNQVVVGPMSPAELREAITYPARTVGLDIEPGLVDLLLRDLGVGVGTVGGADPRDTDGPAGYEAGRLPFLAHALQATWQQRHGSTLTVAGYRLTGGLGQAIATTAERVFAGLDTVQKHLAQSLLLRLVKIGDGTEDTRRRGDRADLIADSADPAAAARVLEVLTRARLITMESETVEITHEALLRGWPRLRQWIDGDRAGNVVHQQLEESADGWDRGGRRDSSALYRGSRLEAARSLVAARTGREVSAGARAFLAASLGQQRRAARLRRAAIAGLVALALAASAGAAVALQQRVVAVRERDRAIVNQVTAYAEQLRGTDASLAAQLDLLAYRLRPTTEGLTRLLTSQNVPLSSPPVSAHTGPVTAVAYSPDGKTVATGGQDQSLRLFNVSDPSRPAPLGERRRDHTDEVWSVAFSPDGKVLASGGRDKTIRLWKVPDLTPLGGPLTGHANAVTTVAFSPDGHLLASSSADNSVRLWNVRDPSRPTPVGAPLRGHTDSVWSVAFSVDGRLLATGSSDHTVRLWDIADPARARPLGASALIRDAGGTASTILSVAFSPAYSDVLVSGEVGGAVRLWEVSDPTKPKQVGETVTAHTNNVWSLASSPDGLILATASEDSTIRLWDLAYAGEPKPMGRPLTVRGGARAAAFGPDGHTLVGGAMDGSIRVWSLPRTTLVYHNAEVLAVAFNPGGTLMASGGGDLRARLWHVEDPSAPRPAGEFRGHSDAIRAMAFNPDGTVLATGGEDSIARLWNVRDPDHPVALGEPMPASGDSVRSVSFSPDGDTLAVAGGGEIQLWNVGDPAHPVALGPALKTDLVTSAVFSADGRRLAAGGADTFVRVWDVSDPARPTTVGEPIGHHNGVVWSLAFSPDGRTLAAGTQELELWRLTDPANPVRWGAQLLEHTDAVLSVAFATDGRRLASGGTDQTVRLWDVADPAAAAPYGLPIDGHTGQVGAVAFNPKGSTVASASHDYTVRLWSLDVNDAIARVCATTGDTLTPLLWAQYVSSELPYAPPCP